MVRIEPIRHASRGLVVKVEPARLHISSSQKHIRPVPVPSIMHTWSTMNKFICSWDVQVLRTLSYAENWIFFILPLGLSIDFLYFYNLKLLTWFSISNHFHAASIASHQWWLIPWKRRIIEWIFASQVCPWITLVAINRSR